jgi:hypothetical protein
MQMMPQSTPPITTSARAAAQSVLTRGVTPWLFSTVSGAGNHSGGGLCRQAHIARWDQE